MTLGELLKELRLAKGLSQPELAAKINIEQSYLSKIENGKSLPSSDILHKVLSSLDSSLQQVIDDHRLVGELSKLKQLPEVSALLNKRHQHIMYFQRKILMISSLLIVLAAVLFYTGFNKVFFTDDVYAYQSDGVLALNEPNDLLSNWEKYYLNYEKALLGKDKSLLEQLNQYQLKIAARQQPHTKLLYEFKGYQFVEEVAEGKRVYYQLSGFELKQRHIANAWLEIIGVALFVMGILGFILEYRFFATRAIA